MGSSLVPILTGAAAAGLFHAFLAGHWLPLVLAARAHGWSPARVTAYAAGSSAIHISVTLLFGALAVLVGHGIAGMGEEALHGLSGWLLLATGVGLGAFAIVGYDPFHRHAREHEGHEHGEDCGEREGWALAVLLGMHPNAAALPVLLAAATESIAGALLAAGAFALSALLGMIAAVSLGMQGVRRLPGGGEGRGGRLATAAALAAVGLWILLGP